MLFAHISQPFGSALGFSLQVQPSDSAFRFSLQIQPSDSAFRFNPGVQPLSLPCLMTRENEPLRHRSHFGSRYKSGCCGHASLFGPGFDSSALRPSPAMAFLLARLASKHRLAGKACQQAFSLLVTLVTLNSSTLVTLNSQNAGLFYHFKLFCLMGHIKTYNLR